MDFSTIQEIKPKMCNQHKEYEISHVCLSPFCNLKRVLCEGCLKQDKVHSSSHHDTIFPIKSFIDKMKGLIASDFYENKIKSLSINDYKKTFLDIIDSNLKEALDEIEVLKNNILNSINKIKQTLIDQANGQKEDFSNYVDSYHEILKKGEKYESKLCHMMNDYNDLMGTFSQIEKIEQDEIYEKQLLCFTNKLYKTINYKNTFPEERSKGQVKTYLKKFENSISNAPDIYINPKLLEICQDLESNIYFRNLIDLNMQTNSTNALPDFFSDDIKIYPNYFYGYNTKYSCLYIHEGEQMLSVKLSENQSEAKISTTTIKNYDFAMKGITSCSIILLPDGRIFLSGGYSELNNSTSAAFYELNMESAKVIKLHPMINDRIHHGTCVLDNKIFVIGGKSISYKKDESLSVSEYYDINIGKWFPIYPTKVSSHHSAICSFDDRFIYKFGGYKNSQPINVIERYSLAKNRWEVLDVEGLGNLNFIAQAEAIEINKNTIMIFGGAANLRNHLYMGINLFLKICEKEDKKLEEDFKYEISMNSKYQIGSPTFFTSPKKCIVHDFSVYAFTNSHHLLKFDGFGWNQLV